MGLKFCEIEVKSKEAVTDFVNDEGDTISVNDEGNIFYNDEQYESLHDFAFRNSKTHDIQDIIKSYKDASGNRMYTYSNLNIKHINHESEVVLECKVHNIKYMAILNKETLEMKILHPFKDDSLGYDDYAYVEGNVYNVVKFSIERLGAESINSWKDYSGADYLSSIIEDILKSREDKTSVTEQTSATETKSTNKNEVYLSEYDRCLIKRQTEALERLANNSKAEDTTVVEEKKAPVEIKEDGEYTEDIFNSRVVLPNGDDAQKLIRMAYIKMFLILVSPPGYGKSTVMDELAKLIVGYEHSDRILTLSFNQNTQYGDFVEGLRQEKNGSWTVKNGNGKAFFDLSATVNDDIPFVLCLDEINRGNTEAILGETISAMECRGKYITTSKGNKLMIPKNLVILATMNTLDGSTKRLDEAIYDRAIVYEMNKGKGLTLDNVLTIRKSKGYAEADDSLKDCIGKFLDTVKKVNEILVKDIKGADNTIGMRDVCAKYEDLTSLRDLVQNSFAKTVERRSKALGVDDKQSLESIVNELVECVDEYIDY